MQEPAQARTIGPPTPLAGIGLQAHRSGLAEELALTTSLHGSVCSIPFDMAGSSAPQQRGGQGSERTPAAHLISSRSSECGSASQQRKGPGAGGRADTFRATSLSRLTKSRVLRNASAPSLGNASGPVRLAREVMVSHGSDSPVARSTDAPGSRLSRPATHATHRTAPSPNPRLRPKAGSISQSKATADTRQVAHHEETDMPTARAAAGSLGNHRPLSGSGMRNAVAVPRGEVSVPMPAKRQAANERCGTQLEAFVCRVLPNDCSHLEAVESAEVKRLVRISAFMAPVAQASATVNTHLAE